ncbi:MAG: hypothetical protein R3293_06290 [Candidatus Promineifilaceae bacterium]|nr:hypothetical protein [Candidatus Promineifilaceae bacterium]
MAKANNHIFVPIKVEALVIDKTVPQNTSGTTSAKWSPRGSNWSSFAQNYDAPGPPLFFNAQWNGDGRLSLPELPPDKKEQHEQKDPGIYVHWVLPPGMRSVYRQTAGKQDFFPPLPDRWLVVRFQRPQKSTMTTQANVVAWLIESDVSTGATGSAVLAPAGPKTSDDNYLQAAAMGKVTKFVPGQTPTPAKANKLVTLTAAGSQYMGSATFSALVADNRNMLSFHDDLSDRQGSHAGLIFSYFVMGWYRPQPTGNEPLRFVHTHHVRPNLKAGENIAQKVAVLEALQWQLDDLKLPVTFGHERAPEKQEEAAFDKAEKALPQDLLDRRTVFHGVVAHINYFDETNYAGPVLGYPGAPLAHGGKQMPRPTLNVSLGNNTADALVALVARNAAEADSAASQEMWKALEAVLYNQPRTLLDTWKEAPREQLVHKSWYSPLDAGIRWRMRAGERDAGSLLLTGKNDQAIKQPRPEDIEPFYNQLEALNATIAQANQTARAIAAMQVDFYQRWWLLVQRANSGAAAKPTPGDLEQMLQALTKELNTLNGKLSQQKNQAQAALKKLNTAVQKVGLELVEENASRFWQPADPVIVIQNAGNLDKHDFPSPLICRSKLPNIKEINLNTNNGSAGITPAANLKPIIKSISAGAGDPTLGALLQEAGLVEQFFHALATGSFPDDGVDHDESTWQQRIAAFKDLFNESDETAEQAQQSAPIKLQAQIQTTSSLAYAPGLDYYARLGSLWLKQPWSPLFLDWQITWYPDSRSGFPTGWTLDTSAMDYRPASGQSGTGKGIVLRGRSLMAPQMGRVFTDPIEKLRALLKGDAHFDPQVAKVLQGFLVAWDDQLQELQANGLLGQALAGFHQVLLGRDLMLPAMKPNSDFPWLDKDTNDNGGSLDFYDKAVNSKDWLTSPKVNANARPLSIPGRYAPDLQPKLPFSLLKAGSFTVDALWIIDDFGQYLDVLGTASDEQLFTFSTSPHNHGAGNGKDGRVLQPPRVLQPARLNFHLVDRDFQNPSGGHTNTDPICGWVFHNFLDQALTLCDSEGSLLGELVLVESANGSKVRWECLKKGLPQQTKTKDVIADLTLRAFADSLIETTANKQVKLQVLLALIDDALATIHPTTTDKRFRLAGRPLALVNACLGLELFGPAWSPAGQQPNLNAGTATGSKQLDKLNLPVQLGHSPYFHDGLIGYYKRGTGAATKKGMSQIVSVRHPADFQDLRSYLLDGDPTKDAVKVGFDRAKWQNITMLMDPHGVVHATSGLVPAKILSVPKIYLQRAQENMELSFRAAPILIHTAAAGKESQSAMPAKMPVPLPSGWKGTWQFRGPRLNEAPVDTIPPNYQPDYGATRPMAVEGRLLLLHKKNLDQWYESYAGVLEVGGWQSSAALKGLSKTNLRQELVGQLQAGLKDATAAYFKPLKDEQVIALGAIYVFLRFGGIRTVQALQGMTAADCRNSLITENMARTQVKNMWTKTSRELVQLGLTWSTKFREHLWQLEATVA